MNISVTDKERCFPASLSRKDFLSQLLGGLWVDALCTLAQVCPCQGGPQPMTEEKPEHFIPNTRFPVSQLTFRHSGRPVLSVIVLLPSLPFSRVGSKDIF